MTKVIHIENTNTHTKVHTNSPTQIHTQEAMSRGKHICANTHSNMYTQKETWGHTHLPQNPTYFTYDLYERSKKERNGGEWEEKESR